MPADRPQDGAPPPDGEAELDRLAEDWITLWQTEIAGLAADREVAEGMAGMAAAWAALGAAWLRAATAPPFARTPPGGPDPFGAFRSPFGPSGFAPPNFAPPPGWGWPPHDGGGAAPPPPGPPPAAAPPDAGGGARDGGDRQREPAGVTDRIAELERRLADLEGGAGGDRTDQRRPRRRRPPA
ncbi:hypothetical protein [Falsiroseomonas stagni]|uniref:hypothetical protein n=1 Tax=Falsiroseomonas stagni TaxID=484882 RepID=UPI001FE6203C|nr:hypothetical protein [Falsiroseomonas stagni]